MSGDAKEKREVIAELIKRGKLDEVRELSEKCEKLCSSMEQMLKGVSPSLEKDCKEFERVKSDNKKIYPELEKLKKAKNEMEETINAVKADVEKRMKEVHELVKELEVAVVSKELIENSIHKLEENNDELVREISSFDREVDKIRIRKGVKFDELLKKAEKIEEGLSRTDEKLRAMEMEYNDVQVMLLNLEI
jgi:chromosome segregation ATPase